MERKAGKVTTVSGSSVGGVLLEELDLQISLWKLLLL